MLSMIELNAHECAWLKLATLEGVGAKKFYDILNEFVDAPTALEHLSEVPHRVAGISTESVAKWRDADRRFDQILQQIGNSGLGLLTRLNPYYPKLLGEIELPPPFLLYRGDHTMIAEYFCGIVGSRKPSRSGFDRTYKIARDLAEQGVIVVSGLARGIDTAAHTGALDADGRTIAVLGCGVDLCYPPENQKLYEQIGERGLVISEYLPGTPPLAKHFPQRNRIIAGFSGLLIAGEGGEKSGARITVDYALRYGREVFAMSCDLKSTMASLPLYLIDSGAPVVQNAAQIMQLMDWKTRVKHPPADEPEENVLDLFEKQIYNLLLKENLTAEQIARELNAAMQDVNTVLTVLELRDYVRCVPGGAFEVIHS